MSVLDMVIRVWTHLYTFALPSEIRDRRRAEIESDVWESRHDPDVPHHTLVIRLLTGVPADLLWRLELTLSRQHARAALGALAGAGVLALALWAFVRQPVPPPTPPRRTVRITLGLMPPPPPPR